MRNNQSSISMVSCLLTVAVGLNACGKKKEKDEAAPAIAATSVAELKLSSSLNISLPDSMKKASGVSTSLTMSQNLAGKKSSEACRTIQQVSQMFDTLDSIGGMMCHLEAESAQIQFGVKYNIKLTEGGQTMSMPLYIDNSVANQLTMYTCQDGAVSEKILISGANSVGPKGSVIYKGSQGSNTYASSLEFDFTTSGVKILKGQNTFSDGSHTFNSDSALDFKDSGVSVMKMSNKGSNEGGSFADRGVVKHNGTQGQALFKGQGTNSGQTYNFSNRATFDGDGISALNTAAATEIKVEASELPEFLADTFAVTAPAGWDCTTEKDIEVNIDTGATGAAHKACERNHNMNFNCWGDEFEQGEQETIE